MNPRKATIKRSIKNILIEVSINLDAMEQTIIETGIPNLDHLLGLFTKNVEIDLSLVTINTNEPIHIVFEAIGSALGEALSKALDDKIGIERFGTSFSTRGDVLSRLIIDLSGRPGLEFHLNLNSEISKQLDLSLIQIFFQSFANQAQATIHIDCLSGNDSKLIEQTIFEAFGKALSMSKDNSDFRLRNTYRSTKGIH